MKGKFCKGFVGVASIGLLLAIAVPATGQVPSGAVSPREVDSFSAVKITWVAKPSIPRESSLLELEKKAGFAPLTPKYLPQGCEPKEQFVIDLAREINLTYSCVFIAQSLSEGKQGTQTPLIKRGSSRPITVNGNPAILVEGLWKKAQNGDDASWEIGLLQRFFEKGNYSIGLMAPAATGVDQLVRIAESL